MDDEKILEKFGQQSERISDALHFAMATNERVETSLKHFETTLKQLDGKIDKIGVKADKTDNLKELINGIAGRMDVYEQKLNEYLGDKKFKHQSIFGLVLNVIQGVCIAALLVWLGIR